MLAALPAELTPEATSERDGFIHVYSVEATAGRAVIRTIVRDFDDERLAEHVATAAPDRRGGRRDASRGRAWSSRSSTSTRTCARSSTSYPGVSDAAEEALRREGFEPKRVPIRGGTDGSILSARGLPTPNLFTGGHEYHSVREWASVQDMASAAAVAVRLAGVWAERAA